MKWLAAVRWCLVVWLGAAQAAAAAQVEYLDPKPLADVVQTQAKPVATTGKLMVPLITWGGDVATIAAQANDLFKQEGLDTELFLENNFPKQVEACLSGKTPLLRGTMGMINSAAEVFKAQGLDLTVVYQLTWSTGGDTMVVRPNIKSPLDLKNRTLALQLYGPHMDYVANVLHSAEVPLSSVRFKWLRELTIPTYDTGGKIVDTVDAFINDPAIDAAMVISPDALNLTSGGGGGTGAAGSVKGAQVLLSTRTASRVIADVYAVRSDYFAKNRGSAEKFVRALIKGQQHLAAEMAKKDKPVDYPKLLTQSADLLLGTPKATADVEGMLGDCEFVGYAGNVQFFTGQGTTRTFGNLNEEIQTAFSEMGLIKKRLSPVAANWDYTALASALGVAPAGGAVAPKFDAQKVAAKVEKQINVEPLQWAERGTLFQIEVNFAPNQDTFPKEQYAADFQKALSIAQTYGGSLIVIEGHSDPLGILKARQNNESAAVLAQMEQQAKNLSLLRARAVRQSFLDYCQAKNVKIDESQFIAVGLGIQTPKFNPPKTKEEWAANRRVLFRIKQVEAELSDFSPLK
jgi:ABC-type nitrate/sulfonate/bicarbonate transport system substrate-binding protein/outer membrane protein OmpA-like peptidoglycan-associated protein